MEHDFVDLWVQFSPESHLEEILSDLQWAHLHGFSDLVVVEGKDSFIKHREGARALGLKITLHRRVPVLAGQDTRPVPDAIWGASSLFMAAGRTRDLKTLARSLGELSRSGYQPVVVGPELNPEVQRIPELLRYLLQAGAVCCGLAGSLVGAAGSGARFTAERLASLGYYSFMAGYVQARCPVGDLASRLSKLRPSWRSTQSRTESVLMERGRRLWLQTRRRD